MSRRTNDPPNNATGGIRGEVWTPSEEDYAPLREAKSEPLPPFIPLSLSDPKNEAQAALAEVVKEDMEDFDPEVDNENDVFDPSQAGVSANLQKPMQRTTSTTSTQQPPSPPPRPQPTQHPQRPNRVREETRTVEQERLARYQTMQDHPVLTKLRNTFGIKRQETKHDTIKGIKFVFRKYNNDAYVKFTSNIVKPTCSSQQEYKDKLDYVFLALGIAAIDDVPLHVLYNIDILPHEELAVNQDPMYPPVRIMVETATQFYAWILSQRTLPEISDALIASYSKRFPDTSFISNDDAGKFAFACPEENCVETMKRVPRYYPNGELRPYYCPVHGTEMRSLGPLEDLANIPLD